MAGKVPESPSLPTFGRRAGDVRGDIEGLHDIIRVLIKALFAIFRTHALRLNKSFLADGTEAMTGPLVLSTYTIASKPDPMLWTGAIIFISDEVGGPTLAYSDGADWLRTLDSTPVN